MFGGNICTVGEADDVPQTQSGFELVPVEIDGIGSLGNGSRPGFIIEIKQHRGSQTRTWPAGSTRYETLS